MRDGHAEPLAAEAYLKQYVEAVRGEPARRHALEAHVGLSQRRTRCCLIATGRTAVAIEAVMNNVG